LNFFPLPQGTWVVSPDAFEGIVVGLAKDWINLGLLPHGQPCRVGNGDPFGRLLGPGRALARSALILCGSSTSAIRWLIIGSSPGSG